MAALLIELNMMMATDVGRHKCTRTWLHNLKEKRQSWVALSRFTHSFMSNKTESHHMMCVSANDAKATSELPSQSDVTGNISLTPDICRQKELC